MSPFKGSNNRSLTTTHVTVPNEIMISLLFAMDKWATKLREIELEMIPPTSRANLRLTQCRLELQTCLVNFLDKHGCGGTRLFDMEQFWKNEWTLIRHLEDQESRLAHLLSPEGIRRTEARSHAAWLEHRASMHGQALRRQGQNRVAWWVDDHMGPLYELMSNAAMETATSERGENTHTDAVENALGRELELYRPWRPGF